jgi:fatty-acyl-CoA synthase
MPFSDLTIGKFFEQRVQEDPTREFMVYADRDLRFTYSEFNERANQLAKGLLATGLKKGDHLGIWATNVPDWLTFMFASAKIGVVLVTVNTFYKEHEVAFVIEQSDMVALAIIDRVGDSDYMQTIYSLVPELHQQTRGHLRSKRFPKLKNVILIGQEKHRGMYNTAELLLLGKHTPDEQLHQIGDSLHCDDVINMQYTSGTTGFPKGVMLTHRNILNDGYYIGERQKFTAEDRLCLPVPLFHCFGCVLGVMAIMTHGATLVVLEKFDPLLVLASVHKERCTAVYGVPTMFIAELKHPMFSMFDLTSLRTGIMAGSPCPIEVMRQVIDKMNCRDITIAYGLTEASPVMTQTRADDTIERRVSTVGQHLPNIDVCIIDPETGLKCPPDTQGEICCRGFNVMKGYYKLPEETSQAIDAEGWLHSGDLGVCDKDGYYRVTGRIKDMIIRGGENIYPREIEEFLHAMPGVENIQVVGVPDQKYGEEAGAFIILKEGAEITPEDVKDYCRNQIARYKIPRHVFFVNEYPLTASGKIQKFKLRELAERLLQEHV